MRFRDKLLQSGITPRELADYVNVKVRTIRTYMKNSKPSQKIQDGLDDMISERINAQDASAPENPHGVSQGGADSRSAPLLVGRMIPMPTSPKARVVKLENGWEVIAYVTPTSVCRRGENVQLGVENDRLVIKELVKEDEA